LDKIRFTILWQNNSGSIDTLKYDRNNIDVMLRKSRDPKARLELIASITTSELDYTLEELVQFLKLGYVDTATWFGPNEDQVHPLSILK